jgi:hypothetical protein
VPQRRPLSIQLGDAIQIELRNGSRSHSSGCHRGLEVGDRRLFELERRYREARAPGRLHRPVANQHLTSYRLTANSKRSHNRTYAHEVSTIHFDSPR